MPPVNNNQNNELRRDIQAALQAFESSPLHVASITLLSTLGYRSDKTIEIPNADPTAFLNLLGDHNPVVKINREKALFDDWLKADILFQLTDEELSQEVSLFKNDTVNAGLLQSYLFFAIELNRRDYARGKLTAIARQLNRVFPMPVMVFIKHGDLLSIAVINRRLNKQDAEKDVLGKVTIIRDISLTSPHRGHLNILSSFALPSLLEKTAITSFDTLHAAWEDIFNVELLNKRFYRELANWYFWALPEVRFPDDMKPAGLTGEQETDYYEKLRATGLIRLLTRLIFCWFLKEKGLIPEALFDQDALGKILKSLDDDKPTYHQAILQNLFFATLNQRMNARGEKYRVFAKDEGFLKNRNTYGVDNLYRYEGLFKDPEAALEEFEDIPFLNGGLFECLDRTDDGSKKIYVDGFSRNSKKRPNIPNRFFFGEGEVDIGAVTGERRRGNENARGLINILSAYKFTIVENTPIDQEIALDPELLGKVFENLLASYNEETKTTARKQTGSFYTPRPIVDYMVDESLKAHLATVLEREHGMTENDARTGLDILFAYTEKQHCFEQDEVDTLIKAIDACKILDPACGSGAFPMGMLHKLVYILTKLDPDNTGWKQTQLAKLDSVSMREDLARTFESNNDDYGRKLYLIENCLYGVDIQPIAIQLSKLRFFISLICDQKTNRNKQQNHGVRPLPNLETKFVAADTLISLDKATHVNLVENTHSDLFENIKIERIEKELQKIRHEHFAVQTRQKKLALQNKDKQLREQLAQELMRSTGADQVTSHNLAQWNPYDTRQAAAFFEPIWMFDRSIAKGFDLVIGNPPYIQIQKFPKAQKDIWVAQQYQTYAATGDIYCLFYERGFDLLADDGVLCFITSNKWMRAGYGQAMRKCFLQTGELKQLIDFGDSPIFSAATTYTNILLWKNREPELVSDGIPLTYDLNSVYEVDSSLERMLEAAGQRSPMFDEKAFVLANPIQLKIRKRIEEVGIPLKQWDIAINYGVKTGCNEAFIINGAKKDELIAADPKSAEIIKPIFRGRDIKRYKIDFSDLWLIDSHNGFVDYLGDRISPIDVRNSYPAIWSFLKGINLALDGQVERRADQGEHWSNLRNCAYHTELESEKIIYAEIVYDSAFYYDQSSTYPEATAFMMTGERIKYLTAILNSRLMTYAFKSFYAGGDLRGNTFRYKKAFLEQLPVPKVEVSIQGLFELLVDFIQLAKAENGSLGQQVVQFLEDLIDACVFELYFHEHMQERELLFQSAIAALADDFDPDADESEQRLFIENLYQTANAPDHPIRNRLLRLTADSPDLLAVIKEHGAV